MRPFNPTLVVPFFEPLISVYVQLALWRTAYLGVRALPSPHSLYTLMEVSTGAQIVHTTLHRRPSDLTNR
jgi:hypothetical protein